jgi:hypothetical protein
MFNELASGISSVSMLTFQTEVLQNYHATLHRVIREHGIEDFNYTFEDLVNILFF